MKDIKKETAEAVASTAAVDGMPEFASKYVFVFVSHFDRRFVKEEDLAEYIFLLIIF